MISGGRAAGPAAEATAEAATLLLRPDNVAPAVSERCDTPPAVEPMPVPAASDALPSAVVAAFTAALVVTTGREWCSGADTAAAAAGACFGAAKGAAGEADASRVSGATRRAGRCGAAPKASTAASSTAKDWPGEKRDPTGAPSVPTAVAAARADPRLPP